MQSLDLVFEAREKKAERQQQKKADRQAAKLKAKEAEQQPNPTCPKPSKASQKHTAGVAKLSNPMTSWQGFAGSTCLSQAAQHQAVLCCYL